MSPRAVLAHHEAGHAVADVLGGVSIGSVSIVDPVGGRTEVLGYDEADFAGLDSETLRSRLEPAVIGLLAGPLAEKRFTGTYDADRAAADLYSAASLGLACLPDGLDWAAYQRGLSQRARDIVRANWSVIDALAAELADLGEMTGAQVAAFMDGLDPKRGRT